MLVLWCECVGREGEHRFLITVIYTKFTKILGPYKEFTNGLVLDFLLPTDYYCQQAQIGV